MFFKRFSIGAAHTTVGTPRRACYDAAKPFDDYIIRLACLRRPLSRQNAHERTRRFADYKAH